MTVAPLADLGARGLMREGRVTEALTSILATAAPTPAQQALELECRLARGEMDRAAGLGRQVAAARVRAPRDAALVLLALGELAAADGRDDEALTRFHEAGARLDDPDEVPWRTGAALSLLRTGGGREADDLATEQLLLARGTGSAYAVAGALRTLAVVGTNPDRVALLREAHALSVGRFARLAAQVATDLAGLLSLVPGAELDRTEAVALLRATEDYADEEDLWPLHSRVRRLLERLGEAPRTSRAEVLAQLTDAELRVARLAGAGSTNRSIAAEVAITVKAVEWHLSHVYRKLGIRTRDQLPQVLRPS